MVTVNSLIDNPQIPGAFDNTYLPDQLIAGPFHRVTADITILSGEGQLARGTVLGQVTIGAASSAAKAGGNTGTGTLVLDVTTPVEANAKAGIYTVRCVEAVVNGGKFQVIDPFGVDLGTVIIPAGAGNSVTFSDQVKFVLTDGGTDFIVGDGFDITVAAGSGKYRVSKTAATDGSQVPTAILVDFSDSTAGDALTGAYFSGEFNQNAMTFGTGFTAASAAPLLRKLSIFLKDALSAADPT